MKNNEELKIRYASLDDVVELLEHPGEYEFSTKYLHEAILSSNQGVILLEKGDEIRGYIHIRRGANGIKIDSYGFKNKEEALKLFTETESLASDLSIYIYIDENNEDIHLFEEAGYMEELRTDDGKIKMVKPWSKISDDRRKELEYYLKADRAEKKHKKIASRPITDVSLLESNLIELETIIEEMRKESTDEEDLKEFEGSEKKNICPVCDKELASERGMKIHKTKVHDS